MKNKPDLLAKKKAAAHTIALSAANQDRCDPFVYARVYTHVINDVGYLNGVERPALQQSK